MTIKTTRSAKAIIEKYGTVIPPKYRDLLDKFISGDKALVEIPFEEMEKWDKDLSSTSKK